MRHLTFWTDSFWALVSLLCGSWRKTVVPWSCHVVVFIGQQHVSSQTNKPLCITAIQILPWFHKAPLYRCLRAFLQAFSFYHRWDVYGWSGKEREGDGQVRTRGSWVSEQSDTAGHRVCICTISETFWKCLFLSRTLHLRWGFLDHGTADIWGWDIVCCGGILSAGVGAQQSPWSPPAITCQEPALPSLDSDNHKCPRALLGVS